MTPIDPQYQSAIKQEEGPEDAGWDYKQYSGPYGVRRGPNEHLTNDEASARFDDELGKASSLVDSLGVPMTKGQKAALTSLTYNAGNKWMNEGLGQAVRNGDWPTAQKIFLQYNRAGNVPNEGLKRRRNQELVWMMQPDTPDDGSAPPPTSVADATPPVHSDAPMDTALPPEAVTEASKAIAPPQESFPDIPPDTLASAAEDTSSSPASGLIGQAKDQLTKAAVAPPDINSLVNEPDAQNRVRQALSMASAAAPYRKVPKSIIPPLQPEDDEDQAMGNLGKPFQRKMADGGIADNSFLDQLQNNPHGMGNFPPNDPDQTYVSQYEPTYRDRAALALSNPEYPVPDSVRSLIGSTGQGPYGPNFADLTGVGPAVDAADDLKNDRPGLAAADLAAGYAIPRGLGALAGRAMRGADMGALYPHMMSSLRESGMPIGALYKSPEAMAKLPDLERRTDALMKGPAWSNDAVSARSRALMEQTPDRDIPYPREATNPYDRMTHGAEYPDLPPRDMQSPKGEENYLNRMHDAAEVEFNNAHEAEPKMWNRDPLDHIRDDGEDHIVNSSDPELDLPRDVLESYRKRTMHADGGIIQGLAFGGPAWYAKNEARGMTHAGPLLSAVPGRTDQLPATVKAGSFVMPADVVSALGQGNTLAGNNVLRQMGKGPFGVPVMHGSSRMPKMPSIGTKTVTKTKLPTFADGGSTDHDEGANVPVILSGGEYVYEPEEVANFGNGDLNQGHQVLNQFVKNVRKQHIETLSSLPPPQD